MDAKQLRDLGTLRIQISESDRTKKVFLVKNVESGEIVDLYVADQARTQDDPDLDTVPLTPRGIGLSEAWKSKKMVIAHMGGEATVAYDEGAKRLVVVSE